MTFPSSPVITYRARWIFPITTPPLADARVTIVDNRVQAIGTEPIHNEVDLGDIALLPAWVNAHTHLDFSQLDQPLGSPGTNLPSWIGAVIHWRRHAPHDLPTAIQRGLEESLQAGVGLLGDITQATEVSPSEANRSLRLPQPIRCRFIEVLGLTSERRHETLNAAKTALRANPSLTDLPLVGISPHAPYSTLPETAAECAELSREYRVPLAMHLAESPHEEQLTVSGSGPFADLYASLGLGPAPHFPNGMCTRDWLKCLAPSHRLLVVHGNYLNEADIDALTGLPQASVIYCPRTHAYFQHPRHPTRQLLDRNVPVALGTDSRASNPDLSIAGEVGHLLKHRPDLSPQEVFRMATLHGANALGTSRFGRIEVGAFASFVKMPLTSESTSDPYAMLAESLLHNVAANSQ